MDLVNVKIILISKTQNGQIHWKVVPGPVPVYQASKNGIDVFVYPDKVIVARSGNSKEIPGVQQDLIDAIVAAIAPKSLSVELDKLYTAFNS